MLLNNLKNGLPSYVLVAWVVCSGWGLLTVLAGPTVPASQQGKADGDADWPLFRGNPMQTGVAKATLPDKLEIRWKVDLKKGIESTAAIVGNTVYVGCYDDHLHAFDLQTGKLKWKTKLGPIKAPPSVYQSKVFVGDEDGLFYCVEADTGKKLWAFEAGGEISGGAAFNDDTVIFGAHDGVLHCLAIKDKSVLWKSKIDGPIYGSPLIADGKTFMAGCDSHLHIIDVVKGKTLAKIELSGQTSATAATDGAFLYVGNVNSEVQAVDLKKNEILWSYVPKRAQPFYSSAALTDKLVIVGSRDRYLHAVNRAKGDSAWAFQTNGRVDSSPVVVGNRVYVGSTNGTLFVVDLNKGTEVQTLDLGQGITASPAVAHGCLVIGTTDGLLYCLGKR